MHRLIGSGLPNVHLSSGYELHEDGAVSYEDVKGLFRAIAKAIACRGADLTSHEFKFLRKRLGKSQAEVGELVGYSAQAVAKWEKEQLPVPVAAGRLLRAMWLAENSKKDLARAVEKMWGKRDFFCHGYVFAHGDSGWVDISHVVELAPIIQEAKRETHEVLSAVSIKARAYGYAASSSVGPVVVERVIA